MSESKRELDAIIAGGGVAGTAAAAALSARGLRVLLCEAGTPSEKRLAGELIHPPAVAKLRQLGLLDGLEGEGMPVYGFVIVGRSDEEDLILSYSEIPGCSAPGLAIEHATLVRGLQRAVASKKGVTMLRDTRVTEAWREGEQVRVTLATGGSQGEATRSAPLLVSAEGRGSRLRRTAGIEVDRGPEAYMVGWRVERGRLPYPGYGHIFTAGSSVALAYQIERDAVRVMFQTDGSDPSREALDALPVAFREDLEATMATTPAMRAKFFALNPARVSAGRFAIVGDAGGCAHPITASGMSFCVDDALRLANAVADARSIGRTSGRVGASSWVDRGLEVYDQSRAESMRVRMALADILSRALGGSDGDALKASLLNYWGRSRRGRAASMALLAVKETRMIAMAREFASVGVHSVLGEDKASLDAMPTLVRLASATTSKALLGPLYDRFSKHSRGRGLPGLGS